MRAVPPRRLRYAFCRTSLVLLLIPPTTWALASEPPKENEPLPSRLEEKVEKHLVQLDVTVEGKSAETLELTAADFEVLVAGREISDLMVDRLCPSSEPEVERAALEHGPGEPRPEPASPGTAPATFVLFFDQPHMTVQGRIKGMDTARDLVRRLIRAGNQGMVVSIARDMKTLVPLTKDPKELLGGLDRLEKDLKQWDSYAATEDSRVQNVLDARRVNKATAKALARNYKREEHMQAGMSLNRLGILLGTLLETKPPKVIFYFADTLRQKAGLHYCLLVDGCDPGEDLIPEAAFEFDRAIDAAAKFGVHVFPIQAEGLPAESGERVTHAEQGLQVLAAETGGEAMIRGISSARFAQRVFQRVSCIYLLSFDPKDLATDKPLSITVRVKRRGLKTRVQGRLVIQSESERATSRLLAAFAAPAAREGDFRVGVELIPLGFEKKRYRTLVQVKVPGVASAGAEMDLGASLLGSGRVREDFSARLKVNVGGVPFVLEKEVEIEPGPFEIAAVGHNAGDGEIGTGRAEGAWPDPRDREASASPIALLQETTAAFSRDGVVRTSGALALSEGDPVRADRSAALVAVVCRNAKAKHPLQVERTLTGETRIDFDPLELGAAQDACIQIRDVIPTNTLGPGSFRYELRVKAADKVLLEAIRELVVGTGADAPATRARPTEGPRSRRAFPPGPRRTRFAILRSAAWRVRSWR